MSGDISEGSIIEKVSEVLSKDEVSQDESSLALAEESMKIIFTS
jgi:hypothetical protein